MTDISIHLWNAADPESEEGGVNFYAPTLPRVGDEVDYWVDYPTHMPKSHGCEDDEPLRVEGVVERVKIDYRYMRGWGAATPRMVVMASVWLKDFKPTYPEKGGE